MKHIPMAIGAVALYGALHLWTGRIDVNNGHGWDGADYAVML